MSLRPPEPESPSNWQIIQHFATTSTLKINPDNYRNWFFLLRNKTKEHEVPQIMFWNIHTTTTQNDVTFRHAFVSDDIPDRNG